MGDNINLSIGQGDLPVTPLQLAVAYATVANGGYVVQPHLGQRIEDADGRVLQEFETPAPRARLDIDPAYRQAILDGLDRRRERAGRHLDRACSRTSPSRSPARRVPRRRGSAAPTSRGTRPITYPEDPQYVVVATDEAGGFGAERAAPDGAADHRRALRREGRGAHDRE